MTRKIRHVAAVGLLVALVAVGVSMEPQATPINKNTISVVLQGRAQGQMREVNGAVQDCFDVALLSPDGRKVLGRGTDCLDLNSIAPIGDDGGFGITNTTIFHLRGGTIVSQSRTTIQPVESPGDGATHITGETSSAANILAGQGTGKFWNVTGSTRLSGAVDLSTLAADNTITFDCIFVIQLD